MNITDQNGFALISSMVILVLLTVIGIAAINTSDIETMIAASEKNRQRAFFAAEAGIEHGKVILAREVENQYAVSQTRDWDSALSGTQAGVEKTDFIPDDYDEKESVIWIKDRALGNVATYTVMVRDNNDDADVTNDSDDIILLTSIATLTDGSWVGIEVGLSNTIEGGSATGYGAQAGTGAGKSFQSDDVNAISDFSSGESITP